jgi:hypothetical protein
MSENQNITQDFACQTSELTGNRAASRLFSENVALLWPGLGKRPARAYKDVNQLTTKNYAIDSAT